MATRELSLLLFNVAHGAAGNADGITADQVAGIKAVLSSGTVQNAQHLFVLASDRGQCVGLKSAALKSELGIQNDNDYICNGTVGIFQRRTEANFDTTFLGKNDRAAFTKVTVPFDGGVAAVNVLLVSYHGKTGISHKERIGLLRDLVTNSDAMKWCLDCQAVIVGGDFNLPLMEASSNVRTVKGQSLTYVPKLTNVPEHDKLFEKTIDFVVYWPNTHLEVIAGHPKMLKWTGEPFGKIQQRYPHVDSLDRPAAPRMCPNMEPFDHPRLLYRFKVKRPN